LILAPLERVQTVSHMQVLNWIWFIERI